jgi:hypothetical protein
VSELDRLEAAASECREMIREAHAATKDLRAAVREAKRELQELGKDEVAAHIQGEVSRQLEELGERTREAVSAATQKVIAEFDRFGESLLGKETYWQTASGRRAVTRPDADVLPPSIRLAITSLKGDACEQYERPWRSPGPGSDPLRLDG